MLGLLQARGRQAASGEGMVEAQAGGISQSGSQLPAVAVATWRDRGKGFSSSPSHHFLVIRCFKASTHRSADVTARDRRRRNPYMRGPCGNFQARALDSQK